MHVTQLTNAFPLKASRSQPGEDKASCGASGRVEGEEAREGSAPVPCYRRSGRHTAAVVEEDVRRVSSSRPLPKEELWTKT